MVSGGGGGGGGGLGASCGLHHRAVSLDFTPHCGCL